ncbi:MAG: NADH-quinone oxidoreductase subunit NuoN [Burkholderiales bacterium]|nr:NADH-quinone oxidoreductase subunit NuoN [Burkholderiales bacterium]
MIDSNNWAAVAPELLLLGMTSLIALFDLAVKTPLRGATYRLTLLTLAVVAALHFVQAGSGETVYVFSNMIVVDTMASLLKGFATIAVLVTLVYSRPYAGARDMLRAGDLFTLSLYSLLGMCVMISGHHFLTLYLGLELLTLPGYALVALRRDELRSTEAAMKYFVLGSLASGFLLYGLSLVYGATGSLDLANVQEAISSGMIDKTVLMLGLVFVVSGLAFKLGAVPFHMWVPDVYHGAPTAVTLMIGGAPKLAAFAIVMRLLVEGMLPLVWHWQQMLIVLAVASLLIGNLAAVAQTNLKRMLAFSTIAQMGFVLLSFASGVVGQDGTNMNAAYSSAMFYMITYVLTTLATFGVILLLARDGFESEEISDLAGLNQRNPMLAAVMTVCMFSLAGVPPLVGFMAKFSVLQSLLNAGGGVYIGLTVFAVMMSLIGAFYYLRVVKVMYFDAPVQTAAIEAAADQRIMLALNGALVLGLGLMPGGLMMLCDQAILALWH